MGTWTSAAPELPEGSSYGGEAAYTNIANQYGYRAVWTIARLKGNQVSVRLQLTRRNGSAGVDYAPDYLWVRAGDDARFYSYGSITRYWIGEAAPGESISVQTAYSENGSSHFGTSGSSVTAPEKLSFPIFVNAGETLRETEEIYANVGGELVQIGDVYTNVGGTIVKLE